MASTSAALNMTMLVAAVFLVLLHSSMGRQRGPPHHCPDDNAGQQPAAPAHHCRDDNPEEQPTPTPAPAPAPTPMPTPAPAPTVDCSLNCSMQCGPQCEANRTAGLTKCDTDYVSNWNGCYDSCTSSVCPDKSACVNSGCVIGNCACQNTNASSCCQWCGQALLNTYFNCRNFEDRYVPYCINNCTNDCNKNCTQG